MQTKPGLLLLCPAVVEARRVGLATHLDRKPRAIALTTRCPSVLLAALGAPGQSPAPRGELEMFGSSFSCSNVHGLCGSAGLPGDARPRLFSPPSGQALDRRDRRGALR